MIIEDIVAERKSTHGPFGIQARVAQELKDIMRMCENWDKMSGQQKESLEMIVHKISRILVGDPNFTDHWIDIEGYARIARS